MIIIKKILYNTVVDKRVSPKGDIAIISLPVIFRKRHNCKSSFVNIVVLVL